MPWMENSVVCCVTRFLGINFYYVFNRSIIVKCLAEALFIGMSIIMTALLRIYTHTGSIGSVRGSPIKPSWLSVWTILNTNDSYEEILVPLSMMIRSIARHSVLIEITMGLLEWKRTNSLKWGTIATLSGAILAYKQSCRERSGTSHCHTAVWRFSQRKIAHHSVASLDLCEENFFFSDAYHYLPFGTLLGNLVRYVLQQSKLQ